MEQERDFFMLLLVEGSTGGERKEFLGGEGQKEFAPEEMEHIQVCPCSSVAICAFSFKKTQMYSGGL